MGRSLQGAPPSMTLEESVRDNLNVLTLGCVGPSNEEPWCGKGEWWLKAQGDSQSDIVLLGIEQNQFGVLQVQHP